MHELENFEDEMSAAHRPYLALIVMLLWHSFLLRLRKTGEPG